MFVNLITPVIFFLFFLCKLIVLRTNSTMVVKIDLRNAQLAWGKMEKQDWLKTKSIYNPVLYFTIEFKEI